VPQRWAPHGLPGPRAAHGQLSGSSAVLVTELIVRPGARVGRAWTCTRTWPAPLVCRGSGVRWHGGVPDSGRAIPAATGSGRRVCFSACTGGSAGIISGPSWPRRACVARQPCGGAALFPRRRGADPGTWTATFLRRRLRRLAHLRLAGMLNPLAARVCTACTLGAIAAGTLFSTRLPLFHLGH